MHDDNDDVIKDVKKKKEKIKKANEIPSSWSSSLVVRCPCRPSKKKKKDKIICLWPVVFYFPLNICLCVCKNNK